MFSDSRFRWSAMMMARPTEASSCRHHNHEEGKQLAVQVSQTEPENPMNARLTALSMISMHIKTVMMFFRNTKPAAPITKSVTLRANMCESGTIFEASELLLCQNHRAQNRHQDQD